MVELQINKAAQPLLNCLRRPLWADLLLGGVCFHAISSLLLSISEVN